MLKQIHMLLLFVCSLFLCQVKAGSLWLPSGKCRAGGVQSELVGGIPLCAENVSKRKIVLQEFVLIPFESSHFNLRARYPVGFSGAVSGLFLWSAPQLECSVLSSLALQQSVSARVNKAAVIFAIREHFFSSVHPASCFHPVNSGVA